MNQFSELSVAVTRLEHARDLPLPHYATIDSAGMDLLAAIAVDITLKPLERALIPTGLAIALPQGYEAQIRPRSGLALKQGISIVNSPGTIDADYRGEIGVILINLSNENVVITRGLRIAQMVITSYCRVSFEETESLSETARGTGGFGSTGMEMPSKKSAHS